jgi:2'-5' RNA ligase
MTPSASVRAFIAVDLAADVRARLVALKSALSRVRCDVRWVRDDGLHATIKFLGAVPIDQLDAVRDAVASAAASVVACPASVRGLGIFPSPKRPRVVWVGLQGDSLRALAQAVENTVAPLGFPTEKRPFHPHVTLGRVNGLRGWTALARALEPHWTEDFGVTAVDHLTTYRSELKRGGSVYTPLWTTPLADSTRGARHGFG